MIPWIGIALPGHVTGYKKEVLCHVTPWAFDELGESVGASTMNRKAIVKSIKYFFEKYRTSAKVASRIPFEDVGDMCTDAIILFWAGYPGVRQITVQEGAHAHDKFLYQFHGLAPIPAGWTLDSQMTDHLPPAVVAMMNLEIDKPVRILTDADAVEAAVREIVEDAERKLRRIPAFRDERFENRLRGNASLRTSTRSSLVSKQRSFPPSRYNSQLCTPPNNHTNKQVYVSPFSALVCQQIGYSDLPGDGPSVGSFSPAAQGQISSGSKQADAEETGN
jgi:hypothetical protein